MNLIKINNNILINEDCISCIEQKVQKGKSIVTVLADGRSYTVNIPIDDFMKQFNNLNSGQHWAG